ncbi:hypothetical protein [Parvibacter caecicola]|nr:hypothetical protein [Parvibacter caecicola]
MKSNLEWLDEPLFSERQIVKVFNMPEDDAETQVCALPLAWVAGRTKEDDKGFLLWPERRISSIPVEFWNHQLMEFPLDDPSALAEFVSTWGIPYHPFRNLSYLSGDMREFCGIKATEEDARLYIPRPHSEEVGAGYFFTSGGSPRLSFISAEELRHSIKVLRTCVSVLVRGEDFGMPALVADVLRVVNSASCNPGRLALCNFADSVMWDKQGETLEARGLLTSAISNQLVSAFADDAEWKVCACEGCGRVFKRKQPDSMVTRPDSDSKYCCTKCKNRQAKRNQREAAKNRTQH